MDAATLSRLSALLDRALEVADAEREAWLASLGGDDAALAPTLRRLLAHAASGRTTDFLDHPPAFTLGGDETATAALVAGDTVGTYRLVQPLGRGGMGEVWLAERTDGSFRRRVALKLPHVSWAPGLAERFARERDILAALEHPNIARLYDAGVDARGRPYMALEYVEGEPLDAYCRTRTLTIGARLRLLLQVADAVAYAHTHLVLHRDLKPGNVLVTAEGQVRLLDFGIAKLMAGDSARETALTRAAGRALTLDYASPEQIRGEPLGTASDVYSFGVVAFEVLAGARPYRLKRGSAAELEEAITGADAPLASTLAADAAAKKQLRGDLDAILNKALKKNPAERYATVDALAQDWRRHLAGARVVARPDSLAYRVTRVARQYRVPLAAGAVTLAVFVLALGFGATAVVILALLLGLGAALWQARQAARARDRALSVNARNEAVTEFLNTVITQAARAGQPMTAEQMLARSEALLEREFRDNPEHRAAVLAMLAMNAHSLGDPARSVALMERARTALGDSPDQPLRDKLDCEYALAIGWLGRIDEAQAALAQVLARPATGQDERAEAHHYLASLAHQKSDAVAGLHHATEALACLRRSVRPSARMETSFVASLGHSCHLAGRNDEADRHYADALARMEALGQERNANAIALLNNWALVHEGAGDAQRALALLDHALAINATDSPDSPRSPFMTVNRARALEFLGRTDEARAAYEDALELARTLKVPPVEQFALGGLASLAVAGGDAAAAARILADADAAGRPGPRTRIALQRADVDGRLALLRGDTEAACASFELLIDGRAEQAATVTGLLGRAEAHRAAGRLDAARTDAADALALARRLQGRKHASLRTGLARLALARIAAASARRDDARREAAEAVAVLAASVDARHPALAEARSLAGQTTA